MAAWRRAARVGAGTLIALAACGVPSAGGRSVTVLAASSLTESFSELARRFERAHPGTEVELSFAASSAVAAQVRAGAPADVVATADAALMEDLTAEGLVGRATVFAHNRLALVVAEGNPHRVGSVADLAAGDLDVVVCAPEVPCGRLAARVLAGVAGVRPRSYEANVKAVLTRVVLGEADAGLVYATDVRSARDRVEEIALPGGDGLVTAYAVAAVARSTDATVSELVGFVRSSEARSVLVAAGFEIP